MTMSGPPGAGVPRLPIRTGPTAASPAAFAAAAAAYTALRTGAARSEALAGLSDPAGGRGVISFVPGRWPLTVVPPARLAARLLAAGLAGALAVVATGWQPATFSGRHYRRADLAIPDRSDQCHRPAA